MSVAKIGDTNYETLASAITAANGMEGGAIIELLSDIDLTQNLTISKNITISGTYTINRTTAYVKTLFNIKSGATLTLDGGLILDCGNNWSFDIDGYNDASSSGMKIDDPYAFLTSQTNGVVATAYVFTVTGVLNLNKVTIQNHYSTNQGLISTSSGATINLNGAHIHHCANATSSGLIVTASANNIYTYINNDTIIENNHVGNNHGLFRMYSGAVLTMNGGIIRNNTGINSNGVVIGLYGAGSTFIMNGGIITNNTGVYGKNNGRNASIYVHQKATLIMNDGVISYNTGYGSGGIDAPYTTANNGSTVTINGGSVTHNYSVMSKDYIDIRGDVAIAITGGTFTQDVSKWCANDFAAVLLPDGTWGVKTTLFQVYVCVDGQIYSADMYTCINNVIYKVKGIQSRIDLN